MGEDSRCTSVTSASIAARFGARRPSSTSTVGADSMKREKGSSLKPAASPASLGVISEQEPPPPYSASNSDNSSLSNDCVKSPLTKPRMRQLYIFANNEDEPLAFSGGDADSPSSNYNMQYAVVDDDLMCFTPVSDSGELSTQEEGSSDIVTWQTFEYDDELQSGATTMFYNFEDDF